MKGFYFITDPLLSLAGNASDARSAVAAGARIVQYRQETPDEMLFQEEARVLRRICRDTLFLINDRVDVAIGVGADGVHLGQGDVPCHIARELLGKGKIIGVTVHTVKEALNAEKAGADYLAISPIFKTSTKNDAGSPVGVALIRKIRKITSLPLAAIGGITLDNAPAVISAGADLICAISPVVTKKNVKSEIRKFQALFG